MDELEDLIETIEKPLFDLLLKVNTAIRYDTLTTLERIHLEASIAKLYIQTSSAILLSKGTTIKVGDVEKTVLDFVSMLNIARSALETYAAVYHIFIASPDADTKNFRLAYSKYRGLTTRQDIVSNDPNLLAKQQIDIGEMTQLLNSITHTQHYNFLKTKIRGKTPQEQLKNQRFFENKIKKGRYEDVGKTERLRNAGISEKTANIMYGYLSDQTHSGYLSLVQTPNNEGNKERAILPIYNFFIAIVFTIRALSRVYPEIQQVLDANPEENKALSIFIDNYNHLFDGTLKAPPVTI